jgi:hypothetical protein
VQIWIDIYGKPESNITGRPPLSGTAVRLNKKNVPKNYADVARELNVSSKTVARVTDVQEDEDIKAELREGKIEATAAQRAVKQRVVNQLMLTPLLHYFLFRWFLENP